MGLGKSSKGKTEGGQGGRRGHSNMTHWERTETIKHDTARARRQDVRQLARAARLAPVE